MHFQIEASTQIIFIFLPTDTRVLRNLAVQKGHIENYELLLQDLEHNF